MHKATLLDGTTVAVKVRRPGVAESMAEDIMLMKHLLALGEFASNSHRDILLSLEGFIEEIERTTASEVDFTSELHNLMRFHDELADEEGVTSPVAYPQYSCESVLVMEFVQGTEISHTQALREQGIDVSALARRVCQSYVTQPRRSSTTGSSTPTRIRATFSCVTETWCGSIWAWWAR